MRTRYIRDGIQEFFDGVRPFLHCIIYWRIGVFTNKKEVDAAMNNSFQDALEMWRLMKGKTLFKNVESLIMLALLSSRDTFCQDKKLHEYPSYHIR